jgi:hypothetical protein
MFFYLLKSLGELPLLPYSGIAEGFYAVGSGSTGVAASLGMYCTSTPPIVPIVCNESGFCCFHMSKLEIQIHIIFKSAFYFIKVEICLVVLIYLF